MFYWGVHRVGDASVDDIKDMLENGIIMSGHQGSGGYTNNLVLSNNVSYFADNRTIVKELMYANAYKNSPGSILVEIPDDDLTKGSLYITDKDGVVRLNPKYNLGFVPVGKTHHLSGIITPKDIKTFNNVHPFTEYETRAELNSEVFETDGNLNQKKHL